MSFLTTETYLHVVALLVERGYAGDREWSENVKAPTTPENFVQEYVWVVLNSGMKSVIARKIMNRVWPVVSSGGSARTVFDHPGKSAAIDLVWANRLDHFSTFQNVPLADLVEWCQTLPWIGPITKFHLAKNLGADVAKPDRWLERLAACEQESVDELCARLAKTAGDRVATVDVVLWRACAIGVLSIADGAVRLHGVE
jgi:hypothetical protein